MLLRTRMALGCALFLSACALSPPPAQRVAEAARELNSAARFGEMDVALQHTAEGARAHFAKHRVDWGHMVRVIDFNVSGLSMKDSENATVMVDIQWTRLDEDTLRETQVEQTWRGTTEDNGWALTRERRVSGDLGLFGERVARLDSTAPREDVQFASKTIR